MRPGWPVKLLLFLSVFLATGGLAVAVGATWTRDLRSPRVVLLGSGNRLSALITDGDARLLIATGDDATAFSNALERARHPTTRRIDVLLVAGQDDGLVAPAALRGDDRVRFRASLGPLAGSAEAVALAGDGLPPLPTPRLIRLGAEVSVLIETVSPEPEEDADATAAWRAVVRRGATTVVLLSDGAAAAEFAPVGPVAALVVAGNGPIAAWEEIDAPLLVAVGDDRLLSGKELRQDAAGLFDEKRWAIRVYPGEAWPLRFVEAGLEAPGEPAQAVGATPPPSA